MAIAAASLVSVFPVGCGGGGGSKGNISAYPEACGKSVYLPNYADGDGRGISLSRWRTFPVRVYIDRHNGVYTAELRDRAVVAFDGWVGQSGGRVQYTLVDRAAFADVTVRFVDIDARVLSNANAVGITFTEDITNHGTSGLPSDRAYLASAEVYIGIDENVTRENGTMAHEFGHALGIGGHSPSRLDLMYRTGSSTRSPVPTQSDINTLRTAYCDDFTQTTASPESRAVVPPSQRGPRVAIP
jgi:predicted Zn-dependent protease